MSLTQEQIKKLAENLSKITLDDPKLTEDINKVLNYMDLLKEVDTS
jgi:Asp-tRNA(Asn)/Glu-tRNA(Gln) amidotransferase C subunit